MGGREALRVIKYRLCLDTPVIFYTAYDFKQNFDFWEAADYLVKSADLGELVDKVKELLRD